MSTTQTKGQALLARFRQHTARCAKENGVIVGKPAVKISPENLDGFSDPADLNAHKAAMVDSGLFNPAYVQYCTRKARAMDCRLMGLIEEARTHEQACDVIYTRIPKSLRW